MPFRASDYIEVKRIPGKGRGVFARRCIPSGTIFEQVPVIVIPEQEVLETVEHSVLADYVFDWGRQTVAIALGFGSMILPPNLRIT